MKQHLCWVCHSQPAIRRSGTWCFLILASIALSCPSDITAVRAQIVPDETLSTNVTTTDNLNFTIHNGNRAGNNLFHSFQEFSLPTGSSAYFNNSPDIQNIFSRVTGSSISNIDGLIRANGTASLFLLNPNGIIFGPNASLNIGGSFVASTASSINFTDGTFFSAATGQTTPLLTISAPIGLQFGGTPGNILNQSRVLDSQGEYLGGLQVQSGKTLALVGGDISLEGGYLTAGGIRTEPQAGGRIELGSVAGFSVVSLTPTNRGWILGYEGVQNFQNIQLSQGAIVDASGEGGGEIQVRGRRIRLTEGSEIIAFTQGSQPGGTMTLAASESIELIGKSANGQFPSGLATQTEGTGAAGNLTIQTEELIMRDGAGISSGTVSAGQGGNLTIQTRQLTLQSGAQILAGTQASGDAGDLFVWASEFVSLSGIDVDSPSALVSESQGTGAGGDLRVETKQLILRDGAILSTGTVGLGPAGNVTIRASELVELSGTSPNLLPRSALLTATLGFGSGGAGNLTIETRRLVVRDGAVVLASTLGQGQGGNLTVNARESVEISGTASDDLPSGLSTDTVGTGDAGNLSVVTERLIVRDGAVIGASTLNQGQGGTLTVNASDVELIGRSAGGRSSGLYAGSGIGDVSLSQVLIDALLEVAESRGIPLGTLLADSLLDLSEATGIGGDLEITTGRLSIQDGATLTVSSPGLGTAGDMKVTARLVQLDNSGTISARTRSGQGGNLNLQAQDLLVLRRGSNISTQAGTQETPGSGGIIILNTNNLVALENSDIDANAFQGQGGQITLNTSGIFGTEGRERQTSESDITATSDIGLSGTVVINTPNVDPSSGLVELPENVVDISGLIDRSCSSGKQQSQFTVTGRGGLPPNPNDLLSSEAFWEDLRLPSGMVREEEKNSVSSTSPPVAEIVEAQGWIIGSHGQVILTANTPTVTPHRPGLTPVNCYVR